MITELITKQLKLRHSSEMDGNSISAQVRWLNDPDVVTYSEQRHRLHSIDTQYHYVNSFSFPNQLFEILLKDGTPIGTISATIDQNNSVANVGILIGEKDLHGRGYGADAWNVFCEHLFSCGVRKIEAGCMGKNQPMVALCLGCGMAKEGIRVAHFKLDKGYSDLFQFGRFK